MLDLADPRKTVGQLRTLFPEKKILFEDVDVKDRPSFEKAFSSVVDSFGSVDIFINGAAIVNEKNYAATVGVNLLGIMHGTYIALEHMAIEKGGKGGTICNVSSALGLDTLCSVPSYTATKHAVVAFTEALADKRLESKFGVKFFTFCPGFTETSMINNLVSKLLREDLFELVQECAKFNGTQRQVEKIFKKLKVFHIYLCIFFSAEACARAFLESLLQAKNGSIFLSNNNELTTIKIPKYFDRTPQ